MNKHRYIQTLRDHMLPWTRETGFYVCENQCPAACSTWRSGISEPTWPWGHGLASYAPRYEPNRTCLGSNVNLDPRHGSSFFQSDRIAANCPPSVVTSWGEMWGHRGKSCLVECGLFLLLEGGTRGISNRVTSVMIEPIHAPCGLVICLWIHCTIMVVWIVAFVAVFFSA